MRKNCMFRRFSCGRNASRLLVSLVLICSLAIPCTAQSVTKKGNTFIPVAESYKVKGGKDTGKYYTDPKTGDNYKIYMGKTGSCYIIRKSKKTGNEYPDYNMMYNGTKYGPIISAEICKELGVEYKPKSKK